MIDHTVPDGVAAMPLKRYLRRAWPMLPGHALRELLRARDVKRDGVRLGEDDIISSGDRLSIYLPERYMPEPAQLIFDDGHILAAVKPQGLPVDVDADGIGADTLLARLQDVYPNAKLCHRLDAATGGLVLAAQDDKIHAQALDTFRIHALTKRYLACVKGSLPHSNGTLRAWLLKDAKRARVTVVHREMRGAKYIETNYRVLSRKDGFSKVMLEPVTGRTHQLRAQMADFGHPILGDDQYGDRSLKVKPMHLWCASMTISQDAPLEDYRGMTFEAPAPKWWEEQS